MSKYLLHVVLAAAVVLHLAFVAPTTLFIGNTLVLGDASLPELIATLAPYALAAGAVVLVVSIASLNAAAWLALFTVIGFQFALFLNTDNLSWKPIAEVAVLAVGCVAAFFVPKSVGRLVAVVVVVVVALNAAFMAPQAWPQLQVKQSAVAANPFDRPFGNFATERFFGTFPTGAPGLDSYSTDRNVVVIVIDTLQNDSAESIVDPATFDGFTFYRNASSFHPYTGMSLPVIHSGEVYQLGEPLLDYMKRADDNRVERELIDRGYKVDHLGLWSRATYTYGAEASKFRANKGLMNVYQERQIPALFRAEPEQIGENNFDGDASAGLTPTDHTAMDMDTFSGMKERMRVDAAEPRFKWMHFWGAHLPATLNANCETIEEAFTHEAFVAQAECMMTQVAEYLEALKQAGVYDQTQIFVIADHGTKELPVNGDATDEPVSWKVRAAAHPMLMIKEAGATGPMVYSDAPVSQAGIKPTILGTGTMEATTVPRIFMDYTLATEANGEVLDPDVYRIGADVRTPGDWAAGL